jgi:uncharacterized protein
LSMNSTSDAESKASFEVDQHITAHSRYFAGLAGSIFYAALRDEKRILGIRCGVCARVLWPPRQTCGRCFSSLGAEDMVEVGPGGTLETFTMVTYSEPVHPRPAPLIYGVIKLDGADTGMTHLIEAPSLEALRIGMRMKAVFSEERCGDILDIRCFRPVDG